MQAHSISNTKSTRQTDGGNAEDVVQVCKAAGDALRANILRALAQDSFGVLELGEIFAMSQPAISHHLKRLAAAGLVGKRREGTSIFYQRSVAATPWVEALFAELDAQPLTASIRRNVDKVYKHRQKSSQAFFSQQADALAQQKALISDPSVYTATVLDCLAGATEAALEVGPGSGVLLKALAERYERVVGVDMAGQMLDTARQAVARSSNVELIEEDFIALPAVRTYDTVIAAMVLHHMPSPAAFFRQAARVLKPGGQLIVAELCDHSFEWVRTLCGDVWLGFTPADLSRWSQQAAFQTTHQQFLAQRNGFRVQVAAYRLNQKQPHQGQPDD